MSRNRMNLLLAVLAAVVVVAGGFFLGIQPQLASASASETQRKSTESTNTATQAELTKLAEENKTLDQQKRDLAALRWSIPDSAAASTFYRELNATAGRTGVTITSITTGDPAAYAAPTDGGATAGAATGPVPATDPAVTASNFSIVPVTVGITGSFDQARAFMKGVQTGDRLFLLTNITSSAESSDGASTTTWTIGGSIYVLTDDTATASATASPSASATPSAG
jgi:Tfp pilus assembly protein PilO